MRCRSVTKRQATRTPTVRSSDAWKKSIKPAACRKRFRAISVAGRPKKWAPIQTSTANTGSITCGKATPSMARGLPAWSGDLCPRFVSKLVMGAIIPEGFFGRARRLPPSGKASQTRSLSLELVEPVGFAVELSTTRFVAVGQPPQELSGEGPRGRDSRRIRAVLVG